MQLFELTHGGGGGGGGGGRRGGGGGGVTGCGAAEGGSEVEIKFKKKENSA